MHTCLYKEILKKISQNIDTEFHSLHILNKNNGSQQIFSNYPKKWLDKYEPNKFHKIDFALKYCPRNDKFIWGDISKYYLNLDELNFFTLANLHGIRSGCSYNFETSYYHGYVTFADADNIWQHKPYDYRENQLKETLSLLTCLFYLEPKKSERYKILLEEIYHSLYDPAAKHKWSGLSYKTNLSPEENIEDAWTRSLVLDVMS